MTFPGFGQGYFDFFSDLTLHNERAWFTEHKARYEAEVAQPLLAFTAAIAPLLAEISPHIKADPRRVGGSMFRIYRDTRFSKDKTPYKTHGALQFRHAAGRDVHAPGFYLHAGMNDCVVVLGIWQPDGPGLQKIREAIVEKPEAWLAARDDAAFAETWTLAGESLKRPPKGFDKDHPLVDDLKRKDHIAMHQLSPHAFMDPDLPRQVADMFARATPYMRFLCRALDLPF